MSIHNIRVVLFFAAIFVISASAWGQEGAAQAVPEAVPAPIDKGPEDALGRGNPHDSIIGYLEAASAFNWEKAAEYLDQRDLPSEVASIGGAELARQFNHVLSR